jgi:hypothetical protein
MFCDVASMKQPSHCCVGLPTGNRCKPDLTAVPPPHPTQAAEAKPWEGGRRNEQGRYRTPGPGCGLYCIKRGLGPGADAFAVNVLSKYIFFFSTFSG